MKRPVFDDRAVYMRQLGERACQMVLNTCLNSESYLNAGDCWEMAAG
jgi:hypothetical protein